MTTKLVQPFLAVDVVLLRVDPSRGGLQVLLQRRSADPFAGIWALPGVAVLPDETALQAAERALSVKGGLSLQPTQIHLEQLATFDALDRDPRGRTVSVAHLGLGRGVLAPGDNARFRGLVRARREKLAFDHRQVLEAAVARLRGKLRYTNIAARLLPDTFTLDELRQVYEAVLERPLNRSNFRGKLLRIGLIEEAGLREGAVGRQGGRPPHVYRFVKDDLAVLERDFV